MANCNFTIPFSGDAPALLSKVKSAIEGQDGSFHGDTTSGSFAVTVLSNTIKGSYQLTGQTMTITITDKPFFIPCATIESYLRSKLS